MYSILMPVSFDTSWRSRRPGSPPCRDSAAPSASCAMTYGKPVIAPEPTAAPAAFSMTRRDSPFDEGVPVSDFDIIHSVAKFGCRCNQWRPAALDGILLRSPRCGAARSGSKRNLSVRCPQRTEGVRRRTVGCAPATPYRLLRHSCRHVSMAFGQKISSPRLFLRHGRHGHAVYRRSAIDRQRRGSIEKRVAARPCTIRRQVMPNSAAARGDAGAAARSREDDG